MKKILLLLLCFSIMLFSYNITCMAEARFDFDSKTGTILGYTGDEVHLIIPDTIDDVEVKRLADYSFIGKDFAKVTIPSTVEVIEPLAFTTCLILEEILVDEKSDYFTSIDGIVYTKDETELVVYPRAKQDTTYIIPEGVKSIAASAFDLNETIETLSIPSTLNVESEDVFDLAALKSYIVSDDNPYITIENGMLYSMDFSILFPYPRAKYDVACIEINEGVKVISNGAFGNDSIEKIILPEGVTTIEQSGLSYNYNLVSLNLPDSIVEIGDGAFACNYSLENITIPPLIKRISDYTFSDCEGIVEIIIPEQVEHIGDGAFGGCSSLEEIVIPKNVEFIGKNAFDRCFSLQRVYIPDATVEIGEFAFTRTSADFKIYCSENSYAQTYAEETGTPYVLVDENGEEIIASTPKPTEKAIVEGDVLIGEIFEEEPQPSNGYILYIIGAVVLIAIIAMFVIKKKK